MEGFESFAFGGVQLCWKGSDFVWGLGFWRGKLYIVYFCFVIMWHIDRLDVYKRICLLVPSVYSLIGVLPQEEKFELGSQLRRAVVSIKSNMKEGSGKRTSKAFIAYLDNAMGSLREVKAQIEIGIDLGYFDNNGKRIVDECWRLERMLVAYIDYVKRKDVK